MDTASTSATKSRVRVLITDDHPGVRSGLTRLLETADDLVVVGVAGCGSEGVRLARELHPDVVLMDLSMPDMDGATATRRVLEARPDTRVVILTAMADWLAIGRARECGAAAVLLKDAPPHELIKAVQLAAHGHRTSCA